MNHKILLLTQNFPPDIGAASFRMESLVKELASRNYDVEVLTAYPNRYNDLRISINDTFGPKVKITRIKNLKQSNRFIQRSFSYLEYFLKSYFLAKKKVKDVEIIIATSPQILTGFLGALLKKRNIPFILDIRDLWPDVMLDLGITTRKSLLYKFLKHIEQYMYKKATSIIVNSPAFIEHIQKYSNKRIDVITNGLDDFIYQYFLEEKPKNTQKGRKIRIVYAGNLGIGQDVKILTEIKEDISKNFEFFLIGNGSQKGEIEKAIKVKKIQNILVYSSRERKELLEFYRQADAFFVHLRDIPMFKKTIPSKVFEYVATKKPVIYGLNGVAKELMDELNAGYPFEAGNVKSLEATLIQLKKDLEEGKWEYKDNGILKEKYLRSQLSKKFVDVIEEVFNETTE
ncbi:hypothetical protein NAAC61_09970 [Petrotoga sp. 8T1HF07.NaAc.6.1]|uniref:glycosyltransferase n=1 Tax=Petrotoga sp. 8T1HF07.NaAc.6.1 TaxID=1351838 RepID=UPI00192BA3BD|nr:hypothetical protein [Petrotoga sp. 8T1HF07.NaAc.6.1]